MNTLQHDMIVLKPVKDPHGGKTSLEKAIKVFCNIIENKEIDNILKNILTDIES